VSERIAETGAPGATAPDSGLEKAKPRRWFRVLRWAIPLVGVAVAAGWAVAGPLPVSWRVVATVERVSEPASPLLGADELPEEVRGMSNIEVQGPRFRLKRGQPAREVVIRIRPRFGRFLPTYDYLDVVWERLDGFPVLMRVTGSVEAAQRIGTGEMADSTLYRTQERIGGVWQTLRHAIWPLQSGEDFPGRFRASQIVIVQRLQIQPDFQDARIRVRFAGTARTGPAPAVRPQPPFFSSGDRVIAEVWTPPFRVIERAVRPRAKPKPELPGGSTLPPDMQLAPGTPR